MVFTCNTTSLLQKEQYCLILFTPLLSIPSRFFFLCVLFQKEGPRIATHLGTSSHVISHAFCLRSCAAHACWDNKLEASLWSWQHGFTKKSWGVSSFPPPTNANDMRTYGAAASGSVTGAFICFHQADTVHEPQVCKKKQKKKNSGVKRFSVPPLILCHMYCKQLSNQLSTDNGSGIVTHHRFGFQCGINCCEVHLTSISVTDENLKYSACEIALGDLVPQVTDN